MELSRFEMASVKRCLATTKSLHRKSEKLSAKIADLQLELDAINREINAWEAPIVAKFGFTPEQILNGDTAVLDGFGGTPEGDLDVEVNEVNNLPTVEDLEEYDNTMNCETVNE